jgi:hypothetical protein
MCETLEFARICGSLGWISSLKKDSLTHIFNHIDYSTAQFSNALSHINYSCRLSMTTSIIIVWIHYIFHSQNEINICVDFLVSFYEVTLNVYVCFMYFSYKYRLILPMEMHLNLHEYSPTLISCKLHLHIIFIWALNVFSHAKGN